MQQALIGWASSHRQRGEKKVASAHPAEEKGFPGVTQSDQQHRTSDSFTCEKVLQKNWKEKAGSD